jgi:two-component system, OmpR family, sensor kinase
VKLRSRVFRYVAAATAGVCVLTVLVAAVLLRHHLAAQEAATLERQSQVVAAVEDALHPRSSAARVFRIGSGLPVQVRLRRSVQIRAVVDATGTTQGRINFSGRAYLFAEQKTAGNGEVILIRAPSLFSGEWRPFLLSLVIAGAAGLLLAAFSAWLLARRLTRPIADLVEAAGRVGAGESDVEVGVVGNDELAGLASSFNEMARGLSDSRAEQRRFVESVSHELKTPLTSIRGYAEAMADGAVEPDQASRVIGAEAGRLERLVADLLDLARLHRAGFSVEHEPVDLDELARRVVERHQPRADALGVELACTTTSTSTDRPASAVADSGRLLQATSNLVENALRLTPAGGTVTVQTSPGRIAVRDTGPGLAEEDLPRVFERFYLYERYRSEREVGTGLGLTIVRELTALMGGEISAQNAQDERGGAIFTLSLPGRLSEPPIRP